MALCTKWKDCPGFVDPFCVVKYCVSLLSRDVYPNMGVGKFDVECSKAKPKDPCDGIKIYLDELEDDPIINQEVRYYICQPCKDEMKRTINKSSRNALKFMLQYLKLRGALILWKVNNYIGSLNSISKARCMIRYATSYLEGLPELDYCAAVCLGRYLQYVMSVSYAHEMFFMKEILSKLYGPLFIEVSVSPELSNNIPPSKRIEYAKSIFEHMLETCPWYQYSPTESVGKSIYPSKQREFTHKYEELAKYIYDKTTLPDNFKQNLGEVMYQNKLITPLDHLRGDNLRTEDYCYHPPSENDGRYPPDKCQLDYSQFNSSLNKALA